MLGNVLLLAILGRSPPDGLAVPDVDFPANNDRMCAACRVQCNEIGFSAVLDREGGQVDDTGQRVARQGHRGDAGLEAGFFFAAMVLNPCAFESVSRVSRCAS
jgi:hypothetical protein